MSSTPDLITQACKWNWSVIQPIFGTLLPTRGHSKTNDSKRKGRNDKKELAQAARRQYLKDLGGYDLSAFPSPTPSGNKIGNCAETWGHCVSKDESHQALELGDIALRRRLRSISAAPSDSGFGSPVSSPNGADTSLAQSPSTSGRMYRPFTVLYQRRLLYRTIVFTVIQDIGKLRKDISKDT